MTDEDRLLDKTIISSVPFSRSVVSNSLRPHGLQHTRPPCPSPTPRAYSNSCTLSQWCHPAISSSVIPFSSCPQSFPASGSFQMSQFFTLGGQSIESSASISVLPMNIQDWSPSGWTGWISLQSKGRSRVFSKTTVQKHQFFGTQLSLWSNFHIHTWPLENLIEKFFYFAATTCSLQDLSSSIRDQPLALAAKAHSPNHWTATEFLYSAHSYGHTHMPPFSIGNEPLSLGITNNSENRLIEGISPVLIKT